MESLTKQTRVRFANTRQENKEESIRDNKIPPQKTQSFGDIKRSQSWIKRQFSSKQMNLDPDFYHTAVVAAAAYAIQSQTSQKFSGTNKTMNKIKSKAEDGKNPPEPLKSSLKFSDEISRKSFKDLDMKVPISTKIPTYKKRLSFADADETISTPPEKPAIDVQLGRPSTFADKHLIIKEVKEPEPKGSTTTAVVPRNTAADAWEKEQITSIKERYEKLKATVEGWKTIKKGEAKGKIERIQAELDLRRKRTVQSLL